MKALQSVLLLLMVMLPSGSALPTTKEGPLLVYPAMDAGNYRALSEEQRLTYVSGLLDGVFVAAWLHLGPMGEAKSRELNPEVNCITTLSHYHVADIIAAYLKEEGVPARELMHTVARRALTIERIIEKNPGAMAGGCDMDES